MHEIPKTSVQFLSFSTLAFKLANALGALDEPQFLTYKKWDYTTGLAMLLEHLHETTFVKQIMQCFVPNNCSIHVIFSLLCVCGSNPFLAKCSRKNYNDSHMAVFLDRI